MITEQPLVQNTWYKIRQSNGITEISVLRRPPPPVHTFNAPGRSRHKKGKR